MDRDVKIENLLNYINKHYKHIPNTIERKLKAYREQMDYITVGIDDLENCLKNKDLEIELLKKYILEEMGNK